MKLQRGGSGVRFAAFASTKSNCSPTLWLDGQRARNMEVDDVNATDIEAIELYENWTSTPAQFSEGTALPCGTIVIWTRTR